MELAYIFLDEHPAAHHSAAGAILNKHLARAEPVCRRPSISSAGQRGTVMATTLAGRSGSGRRLARHRHQSGRRTRDAR